MPCDLLRLFTRASRSPSAWSSPPAGPPVNALRARCTIPFTFADLRRPLHVVVSLGRLQPAAKFRHAEITTDDSAELRPLLGGVLAKDNEYFLYDYYLSLCEFLMMISQTARVALLLAATGMAAARSRTEMVDDTYLGMTRADLGFWDRAEASAQQYVRPSTISSWCCCLGQSARGGGGGGVGSVTTER